jgi:hypothetical protein
MYRAPLREIRFVSVGVRTRRRFRHGALSVAITAGYPEPSRSESLYLVSTALRSSGSIEKKWVISNSDRSFRVQPRYGTCQASIASPYFTSGNSA